jgi:hypothetical protein
MHDMKKRNSKLDSKKNKTTQIITTIIGILLAIAGFEHGLFEALQGNKPTGGIGIHAISESMKWWKYGTEDALTIIPNFLLTGITAMCVSIFIIIWSLFFIDKKYGRLTFLLLFILLTIVGGGVGFVPFFIVTWAYATRMNKNLNWWNKVLIQNVRKYLARIWRYTLTATAICWFLAMEIAVFGYFPGQTNPETLFNICWTFLLFTMIFINLSYISGFAHDIERHA